MPDLKKPKATEICPPGYHIVRAHERTCASGTKTWVDPHRRRNQGPAFQILLEENIKYLFWASQATFPSIGTVYGYEEHAELDAVIQFWLEYWTQQGLGFPEDLDPLLVKVLIAIESSFNTRARAKSKDSSATGLMQVTNLACALLEGAPDSKGYREVKAHYLSVSRDDLNEPVVAIAVGTRWLAHKFSMIPKHAPKNLFNTLKNYYSWNKGGDDYAKKVLALYAKSKR